MDRIREFNAEYDLETAPEIRLLDLESETGELAKELLKANEYGEREVEVTPELKDEFGAVYYSLLSLASELEIAPEKALESSIEKYRERFENEGSVGSGE